MGLLDRIGEAAVITDGVDGEAKILEKTLTRLGAMGLRRRGGGTRRFAPAEAQQTAERIATVAKLQQLREEGELSEEEYEAERRRVQSD